MTDPNETACPDHRPVLDADVGWYCAACGAEAPADALAPAPAGRPATSGPDETASLVGEITEAWREHLAEEVARRPVTYNDASTGSIVDQIDRYRELADHDTMARSIATLKARGTYEPNKHVNDEKFPPMTVAEYLEMLALGERIAWYYRHPSQVDHAVKAGASWAQIAAATGTTERDARAAYREWADGQHRLHAGIGIGMDDAEYAAALDLAAADVSDATEDGR